MTRTAGAQIGCQRPSRFWGLGCPKIYHEAEDTLECRQSLPEGCCLSALRIDAAGYQTKIIEYCDKEGIAYAHPQSISNHKLHLPF